MKNYRTKKINRLISGALAIVMLISFLMVQFSITSTADEIALDINTQSFTVAICDTNDIPLANAEVTADNNAGISQTSVTNDVGEATFSEITLEKIEDNNTFEFTVKSPEDEEQIETFEVIITEEELIEPYIYKCNQIELSVKTFNVTIQNYAEISEMGKITLEYSDKNEIHINEHGSADVKAGNISITVVPNENGNNGKHYRVESIDGNTIDKEESYKEVTVSKEITEDTNISIIFKEYAKITVNKNEGGDVSFSDNVFTDTEGVNKVDVNETIDITATPKEDLNGKHYRVNSIDGKTINKEESYKEVLLPKEITEDTNISIIFKEYAIVKTSSYAEGSISLSGNNLFSDSAGVYKADVGENVDITATPKDDLNSKHYRVSSVTIDKETISIDSKNNKSYTGVTEKKEIKEDISISAGFKEYAKITVNKNEGGDVSFSDNVFTDSQSNNRVDRVDIGEKISVTIKSNEYANDNKERSIIDSVSIDNNKEKVEANSFEFNKTEIDVTKDINISVNFIKQYLAKFTVGGNGKIKETDPALQGVITYVNNGGTLTFSAEPEKNYRVSNLTVRSNNIETVNEPYNQNNLSIKDRSITIDAYTEIEVAFSINQYNVKLNSNVIADNSSEVNVNGKILKPNEVVDEPFDYDPNTSTNIIFNVANGYKIQSVSISFNSGDIDPINLSNKDISDGILQYSIASSIIEKFIGTEISEIPIIDIHVEYQKIQSVNVKNLLDNDYFSIEFRDVNGNNINASRTIDKDKDGNTVYIIPKTAKAVIVPKAAENYKYIKQVDDLDSVASLVQTEESKIEITSENKTIKYILSSKDGYLFDNSGKIIESNITIAFDDYAPTLEITELKKPEKDIYNYDVDLKLSLNDKKEDDDFWSGLDKVVYTISRVSQDSESEFRQQILYENTVVEKDDKTITVDAETWNYSDVKVIVRAYDKAGNLSENEITLNIDVTNPTIKVEFNNAKPSSIVDGCGYYNSDRKAVITIEEKNFDSDLVEIFRENGKKYSAIWENYEGDIHKAEVPFFGDIHYHFSVKCTDIAGNKNDAVNYSNSYTPQNFVIDKTKPIGKITIGELGAWEKLLSKLTFGLYSNNSLKVTTSYEDIKYDNENSMPDLKSVEWIKDTFDGKNSEKQLKTSEELDNINNWNNYNGPFKVEKNERFVIYLKITDLAGNVTYISSNGVIVDKKAPVAELIKPEITVKINNQTVNDIYNTNVDVDVKVVDPIINDTYSGLKKVTYEVIKDNDKQNPTQSGTLYNFNKKNPTQKDFKQVLNKKFTVKKSLNNSNNIKILVYAEDNSGNHHTESTKLKIDTSRPEISIAYDNNDSDTSDGKTYFNKSRTATISISERNFKSKYVDVKIENSEGSIPQLSDWKSVEGTELHTATVTYADDGDYKFNISVTDSAGNKNSGVNYNDSAAPKEFTIDKVSPDISMTYDNNSSQNGSYYKDVRTATITVVEHNFAPDRINVNISADGNGNINLPSVSEWTSVGDKHYATVSFNQDAKYSVNVSAEDKSRNKTENTIKDEFYLDQTKPNVVINNIVDKSANNEKGNIGFELVATDSNFDLFEPELVADFYNSKTGSIERKSVELGTIKQIENGKKYVVENLDSDGFYSLKCKVVDKAGNEYDSVIGYDKNGKESIKKCSSEISIVDFTVNRNGSTFRLSDNTNTLKNNYYVQSVYNDIVVIETNVDPLKSYSVTVNGNELHEGDDYTVEKSNDENWNEYTYKISKSSFENEGEYKVVVTSKDKAQNEAFSDMKSAELNFVVDKTKPVIDVSGLESDGRYQTDKQLVNIMPTDDGGMLKSVRVEILNRDGDVTSVPIDLSDDALNKELEKKSGKLSFEIKEGLYQQVRITSSDCSFDIDNNTNTYQETFTNVSVSTSFIKILWANTAFKYTTLIIIILFTAAVIVLLIYRKNHSNSKKQKYLN